MRFRNVLISAAAALTAGIGLAGPASAHVDDGRYTISPASDSGLCLTAGYVSDLRVHVLPCDSLPERHSATWTVETLAHNVQQLTDGQGACLGHLSTAVSFRDCSKFDTGQTFWNITTDNDITRIKPTNDPARCLAYDEAGISTQILACDELPTEWSADWKLTLKQPADSEQVSDAVAP